MIHPARSAAVVGSLLLLAGCSLVTDLVGTTSTPLELANAAAGPFRVSYVVDGDTVDVETANGTIRVRLIGIDAPEDTSTTECFGPEATAHLRDLVEGTDVLIEVDPSQGTWDETSKNFVDRYGRTLAYLWTDLDTQVNALMIEGGYAHEYTFGHTPYAYQPQFQARENAAREAGAGLWAADTCDGRP